MQQPFLALITPLDSGPPPPGGGAPGYPTHPWVPPWGPTHPIAPGGPPPGIWGGRPPEYVDIGGPGPQPPPGYPTHPWVPPYGPSHPIYYPPLGIWGGRPPNYVDIGGPGSQPYPSHPIYYPPVIWDPTFPTNPIVRPGDPEHPGEGQPATPRIEWKTAWSPSTGWIVVGIPTGEHVTPSGDEPKA